MDQYTSLTSSVTRQFHPSLGQLGDRFRAEGDVPVPRRGLARDKSHPSHLRREELMWQDDPNYAKHSSDTVMEARWSGFALLVSDSVFNNFVRSSVW